MAEACGNRTHRRHFCLPTGFEVREGHQRPIRFRAAVIGSKAAKRPTGRRAGAL